MGTDELGKGTGEAQHSSGARGDAGRTTLQSSALDKSIWKREEETHLVLFYAAVKATVVASLRVSPNLL